MADREANYFPSTEVVDLTWRVAQASNSAFDRMKQASQRYYELKVLRDTPDGDTEVSFDRLTEQAIKYANARNNFNFLCTMASHIMLMDNSPFAPD